ncbi:Hypothetical predicted protein [Octopus vulgaris]|uniref:Uncharacterized protein n=1 Tax=Octopus vulgaris TaxID=6645 RepID=A0AA36BJ00_OCTVU|nr:Hypothetical predicted protein [Octopus vulgaris]
MISTTAICYNYVNPYVIVTYADLNKHLVSETANEIIWKYNRGIGILIFTLHTVIGEHVLNMVLSKLLMEVILVLYMIQVIGANGDVTELVISQLQDVRCITTMPISTQRGRSIGSTYHSLTQRTNKRRHKYTRGNLEPKIKKKMLQ